MAPAITNTTAVNRETPVMMRLRLVVVLPTNVRWTHTPPGW